MQEGPWFHPCACTLEWWEDKDTLLMLYWTIDWKIPGAFVWHYLRHQPTATGKHSQHLIKTGTWNVLPQSSLQHVHWGHWSSCGGTSVEALHALLSENSCLRWQSSTCPTWIWPTRGLCLSRPNVRGGVAWPLNQLIGLKVEEAMVSGEINAELLCLSRTPSSHQKDMNMMLRDTT